jgi:hypothetical protein
MTDKAKLKGKHSYVVGAIGILVFLLHVFLFAAIP